MKANRELKYHVSVIFKVHTREQYSALNYWLRQPRFIQHKVIFNVASNIVRFVY